MNNFKRKFLYSIMVFVFILICPIYAIWGKTEKGGIYWLDADGTFPTSCWRVIDDDGDGYGFNYYFNQNGFLQIDDITPDYSIVDSFGRKIGMDGKPIIVVIEDEIPDDYVGVDEHYIYNPEILAEVKKDQGDYGENSGYISSGQYLYSVQDEEDGPKPSDFIVNEVTPNGLSKVLLGANVTLKEKKATDYDVTISRKMVDHINSGSKYSKKVNGTTFTKQKWKEVMALNGNQASITFTNPSHNFNRLKGRIATHYFTYTDRTTMCTLNIYNVDDPTEPLMTVSDFNYNSGDAFECIFPRKASAIRFELEVIGKYITRPCYLRDCTFAFDKDAYEEELYDDDTEALYIAMYGTDSEAEYMEEAEDDDSQSIEGEDPGQRYARLHGLTNDEYLANFSFDEDDTSISAELRASVSEARKRLEAVAQERNKVSGPAYDKSLNAKEKEEYDPLGNIVRKYIPGTYEGDAE